MSNTNGELNKIVECELKSFLIEFIKKPYLCYTEHGLHALFFQRLYDAFRNAEIKNAEISVHGEDKKVEMCRIQKEYPTNDSLGKPRRQHWDIAVIKDGEQGTSEYDRLPLCSIIEFGLNANLVHLIDDFLRIRHYEAKTDNAFLVHLCRFSGAGKNKLSCRDFSCNSKERPWREDKIEFLKTLDAILRHGNTNRDELKNKIHNFLKGSQKSNTIHLDAQLPEDNSSAKQRITVYFGLVNIIHNKKVLWKHNGEKWEILDGGEWWPNS